jgi:hypothetical protein
VLDDELCYKYSEYGNIHDVFVTRARMFRNVYLHKCASSSLLCRLLWHAQSPCPALPLSLLPAACMHARPAEAHGCAVLQPKKNQNDVLGRKAMWCILSLLRCTKQEGERGGAHGGGRLPGRGPGA